MKYFTARVHNMNRVYVFTGTCLLTGDTPFPSHNTSTGSMSFPGGVPHLHPIIVPFVPSPFQGVPHLHPIIVPLVSDPFQGVTSGWGTSARTGGVPPWDRLCLGRLCRGLNAFSGFLQDDFLVLQYYFVYKLQSETFDTLVFVINF